MNRTILERVRCMLSNAKLIKQFWGETAHTTTYIINRSPSVTIQFKTPEELWKDMPPSLKHLRIFGCDAYIHTNKGKLEPRSKKGIFLRYLDGVKGYKVWIIESLLFRPFHKFPTLILHEGVIFFCHSIFLAFTIND